MSADDIVRIGACVACGKRARLRSGGCEPCITRLGESWFALSERVQRDPVFARAAFARIDHRLGQGRFVEMYGIEVLGLAPVASAAVNLERVLVSEGRWERRLEWAIPPPRGDGD